MLHTRSRVDDIMENKKTDLGVKNGMPAAKSSKNVAVTRKMSSHPTVRRTASDFTSIKIVTKRKDGEKKPFPWTTVITAVCFTVLFLFMMMNYISLDNLSDKVAEQNTVINNLSDQKNKLEDRLAKKDNLDEITKYAENELGMVKREDAKGEYYIDIKTDDEVQINRYDDENENGLGVLLTGAGNIIRKFFGG